MKKMYCLVTLHPLLAISLSLTRAKRFLGELNPREAEEVALMKLESDNGGPITISTLISGRINPDSHEVTEAMIKATREIFQGKAPFQSLGVPVLVDDNFADIRRHLLEI